LHQHPHEPYVTDFAERHPSDRLFLPFTEKGRDMLIVILADRRLPSPPFFAFGANAEMLEQLERHGAIDIIGSFNTERPCFRSRVTNRITGYIDSDDSDFAAEPSMSLRSRRADEMRLRPEPVPQDEDDDTRVGAEGMSIRARRKTEPSLPDEYDDEDTQPSVLTMRQLRAKIRAEEAAAQFDGSPEARQRLDPLHWLLKLFSSLLKPK
jgi:hypothetical protein